MNQSVNNLDREQEDGWPPVMSKAEFARYRREVFGAGSKSLISKYIANGKIAPPALRPDGRIDRALADAQLARTVGNAKGHIATQKPDPRPALPGEDGAMESSPPADGTLAAEQIALTRARRRRIEMEMEREAGKLVYAEDAAQASFDAARRVRDRLLAIPGRLAPHLVGKTDREIAVMVRDAMTAALNDAADDLEQIDMPAVEIGE